MKSDMIGNFGRIVFGKLEFEIYSIEIIGGEFRLGTIARHPRPKYIRALPDHGRIPYVIYGMDGELVATGSQRASIFDEVRAFGGTLADIYMVFPIRMITEMTLHAIPR